MEGSRKAYLEGQQLILLPQVEEAYLDKQHNQVREQGRLVVYLGNRITLRLQHRAEAFLEELSSRNQQEDFLEANSKPQLQLREEDYLAKIQRQHRVEGYLVRILPPHKAEAFSDRTQHQPKEVDYLVKIINKSQQEPEDYLANHSNNNKIKAHLVVGFLNPIKLKT